MPLFKGKGFKSSPSKAIKYITREDKAIIISSQALDDSRDYTQQFKETCDLYGKGRGSNERKYYHFKLSCDPKDNVTPEQSHKLAEEVAKKLFGGYECVIATHNDTKVVHSHIVVNAVSYETGLKLHLNKAARGDRSYAHCKDVVEELAFGMGLSIIDWRKATADKWNGLYDDISIGDNSKYLSQEEKIMLDRLGDRWSVASWKDSLRNVIDEAKAICTSREEFQLYLKDNYNVEMPRNTGKTISFKHPNPDLKAKPIRGAKLGADYATSSIDKALRHNKERRQLENDRLLATQKYTEAGTRESAGTGTHRPYESHATIDIDKSDEKPSTGKQPTEGSSCPISEQLRRIHQNVHKLTADGRAKATRNAAKQRKQEAARLQEFDPRAVQSQNHEPSTPRSNGSRDIGLSR